MDFCSKCNGLMFAHHVCPPKFQVYHREYRGDKPLAVYAYNAEAAAKKYADRFDSDCGDCPILDGNNITVRVVSETGEITWFEVSAEPVPQYIADEINEPEDERITILADDYREGVAVEEMRP